MGDSPLNGERELKAILFNSTRCLPLPSTVRKKGVVIGPGGHRQQQLPRPPILPTIVLGNCDEGRLTIGGGHFLTRPSSILPPLWSTIALCRTASHSLSPLFEPGGEKGSLDCVPTAPLPQVHVGLFFFKKIARPP